MNMEKSNKNFKTAVVSIVAVTLVVCLGFIAFYFLKPSYIKTETGEKIKEEKLDEEYIRILACGVDKSDRLTDVIMYALYDVKNQEINVLQIPRDTFVGTEYITGKINGVYGSMKNHSDGMMELKGILKEQLKLDTDYTALITLEGVSDIIDSLGGVKMNIPFQMNYLPDRGQIIYPGEQIIDGEKAEWLVRFRSGYQNADIGRMNMQKEFLIACLDTVHQKGRMAAVSALMQNFDEVKTDMPLTKAVSLAKKAFEIKSENIHMYALEGDGTMYGTYAVFELDKEKAADILNEHFRLKDFVSAEDLGILEVPYVEVPKKEPLRDEEGRLIDEFGYLIDDYGNPIDEDGNYIRFALDDGTPTDKYGNPVEVDDYGYPIYENKEKVPGALSDDQEENEKQPLSSFEQMRESEMAEENETEENPSEDENSDENNQSEQFSGGENNFQYQN